MNFYTIKNNIISKVGKFNAFLIFLSIIIAAISILYLYYMFYNNKREGFNPSTDKHAEFMLFFANWCPVCTQAKPDWDSIKSQYANKTLDGYYLLFTENDCSEDTPETKAKINKYNIEHYPTLMLFKDGKIITYEGRITTENLQSFIAEYFPSNT